tara:strand:+ start:100 stop:471 length:372 start_codon:yes stop_codon:yes gene_type:complete
MARFISVVRQNIGSGSANVTPVITGTTNTSGVPANTYGVLLSVMASNTTANSQNVTVELVKSGATTTGSLITSGTVPNQASLEFLTGNKVIVESEDVIRAYASTGNAVDITVSYMLNTQDNNI